MTKNLLGWRSCEWKKTRVDLFSPIVLEIPQTFVLRFELSLSIIGHSRLKRLFSRTKRTSGTLSIYDTKCLMTLPLTWETFSVSFASSRCNPTKSIATIVLTWYRCVLLAIDGIGGISRRMSFNPNSPDCVHMLLVYLSQVDYKTSPIGIKTREVGQHMFSVISSSNHYNHLYKGTK